VTAPCDDGRMGLGDGPGEWDDYEWFTTRGRASASVVEDDGALAAQVVAERLWVEHDAPRILLVDLDNLRAGPARWAARMGAVVALARQADHVVLAGQEGQVRRARPHLAEFVGDAVTVPKGSDLADVALLEAVDTLDLPDAQALVVSNDGIFAELAQCGPLVVLSPGRDALSDSLAAASVRVIDLAALEHDLPAPTRA
jgi:hypothetical protein